MNQARLEGFYLGCHPSLVTNDHRTPAELFCNLFMVLGAVPHAHYRSRSGR